MSITFKCTPFRSVFESKENDYKIYAADCDDERVKRNRYGNITLMGNMPELSTASEYRITANEEISRGETVYRVRSVVRDIPLTEEGTRLFLSEILPYSQVNELLREYPNIIEIVTQNRMHEIDLDKLYNIKHERIKVIQRKILENFVFAQLVDEFKGLISFSIIRELYNAYEDVNVVKNRIAEDPYGTLCRIGDVGFKTADKLLLDFEKESEKLENPPVKFAEPLKTSSQRMEACMTYVLEQNEMNGNTKMAVSDLKVECKLLTPECMNKFDNVLANENRIVYEGGFASRLTTYEAEEYVAIRLLEMVKADNIWELDLSEFNNEYGMTEQQLDVIKNVANVNVSICNGGAGTGKSYSVMAVVEMLQKNGKSITIVAPTGRASKVINGYAKHPASTIHRLLYSLTQDGATMKIPSDIVIIDEMSMPDVFLFKWLLESVDSTRTKILMIGDSAQISSIGAGNLLHDMLNSSIIPTTILDKVFRYGEGGIMTVATNTKMGQPSFEDKSGVQVFGTNKDYTFISSSSPEHSFKTAVQLYEKLLQTYSVEDVIMMSPYNVGELGSIAFNNALQPIANPTSKDADVFLESNRNKFYVGDMVMQTKNNYKSQPYVPNSGWDTDDSMVQSYYMEDMKCAIFNGDIGKIERIHKEFALIDFDGIKVVYGASELTTCQRAYSINTYKLQGSNARIIILITGKEHARNMTSNLLYVAQTRAREKVYHIGDIKTINEAVKKKAELSRLTYLREFLERGMNN